MSSLTSPTLTRVRAVGKMLMLDEQVFRVRGTTYGTFGPRLTGELFPDRWQIKQDLFEMAQRGFNVVRTYTTPPSELLEIAGEAGLRVLVGAHYEDWRNELQPSRAARHRVLSAGRRAIYEALELCAGCPDVLAITVGNEVPADLIRLHGISAVEDVLSELVSEVHESDSEMLATYCNFPTTEYLRIDGIDLACFNVFLENPRRLKQYIKRLHNVASEVPLVITELGLASEVHGEREQADSLSRQLRTIDETGCAGATVFSWTDDWVVGGFPVEGWGFGLTDAGRNPKPALAVAERWARETLRELRDRWPSITVIVCAHNEAPYIEECLSSLSRLDYPDLEVIVVDDGSTDGTAGIASRFSFKVISLPHGGLSAARNAGLAESTREIIAYIDADAQCHPDWPYHIALSIGEDVAATGGPNHPVESATLVERAVSHSPGGPTQVLVSDDRAEHVPGCNMAFRREALEAVGGFDPVYTSAGDDVDICWRILEKHFQIGYSHSAQVTHHRPHSVWDYLRQQRSYGRAERMLSGPHGHRFNRLGQARWAGSVYGGPRLLPRLLRPVIYHGYGGLAPFQRVVRRRSESAMQVTAALLPLILLAGLAGAALAALSPWWLIIPALAAATIAGYGGWVAASVQPVRNEQHTLIFRALVVLLHLLQPLARTWGRIRGKPVDVRPNGRIAWTGDRGQWLLELRRDLSSRGCAVAFGDPHSPFDLEISIGPLWSYRLVTAVAWASTPLRKLALRPRLASLIGLPAAAGAAYAGLPGRIALAVMSLWLLVERWALRGRIMVALDETTRGAPPAVLQSAQRIGVE